MAGRRSLLGLDGLSFFLADIQTGVGPFIAIYLASAGWNAEDVGLALTAAGIAGIVIQTPVGWLIDRTSYKRLLIGVAVGMLAVSSLCIAWFPTFGPILAAQVVVGVVSSVFIPAVCAMSLGIVGHDALDARQGRNQTLNAAGNVVAAVAMGGVAYLVSDKSAFFLVAATALPTFGALLLVDPNDIDHDVARGAGPVASPVEANKTDLFRDRSLAALTIGSIGFHLANAAMLPLLGEQLAKGQGRGSMLFMAACVVTTQLVVVLSASTVGRMARRYGRKPLLLVGFGVLPVRGVLYTLTEEKGLLVAVQVLDGLAAAVFGVVSILIIADRTRGTGRFNVTLGAVATAVGIGAAVSQAVAGSLVHRINFRTAFLTLAGLATIAFIIVLVLLPETLNRQQLRTERAGRTTE